MDAKFKAWEYKVIPMPKKFNITDTLPLTTDKIYFDCTTCDSIKTAPEIKTAMALLSPVAKGSSETGDFPIRMSLAEQLNEKDFGGIKDKLSALPNASQSYAILPEDDGNGLRLIGTTHLGLLYAVRTLMQLIGDTLVGNNVEIPVVNIIDWPDMTERGQWGGNTQEDIEWTSNWKLNVVEASAKFGVDDEGMPAVGMDSTLMKRGKALGVKIVPYVLHLEQISLFADIKDRKEMLNVPDPSKPLPSDYFPALCMSSPATHRWIEKILEEIMSHQEVTDIMVWLSENATPCFCPKCIGKEPFVLEVQCIVESFRKAQEKHPNVKLRLLSTQGSYPVNDQILAILPHDVGITYYDGGRTYDSSRSPMIYPLLEEYSKSGGWLGVYPQITHCWRIVFPWTAPDFLQYRAQEFVDKKLDCVIGYAVPSNRFHEFNVMALGEWTWNSNGRTPEEFLKAYAYKTGICEPEIFAKWGLKNSMAGWTLAESRLFLTLIFNPTLGIEKVSLHSDHRFEMAGIVLDDKIDEGIRQAEEAFEIASASGVKSMIIESESILCGLRALKAIDSIRKMHQSTAEMDYNRLSQDLDTLDSCAYTLKDRLIDWGEDICVPLGEKLPTRLLDTAFVMLRTCDAFRKWASELGITDPYEERRLTKIGEWSAKDFQDGSKITIQKDLSDIASVDGGEFNIRFDFIHSNFGTDIEEIAVYDYGYTKEGEQPIKLAETPDILKRVSIWEPWCEMRITVPPLSPESKPVLNIQLKGLSKDALDKGSTCSGTISIRKF